MSFSWKGLKTPFVGLAPMADYTDSPFTLICKKFGADVIYREMVSAEAIVRGNEKTLKMAEFDKKERPIILQIFGADPKVMAEAAAILEEKFHPDGIDINMGCPARKIISNFNGASLMRDPKLAAKIIQAVKGAVAIPVSVKTRTGWSQAKEILKFAPIVESAGADAIAIHGRTKSMGYAGKADWEIIGCVREKLSIPVLLNGDVYDFESFSRAIAASGTDGVLIGRGALGNPWIFEEIKEGIPPFAKDTEGLFFQKKIKIILSHAKLHLARHGELTSFRKHAIAYFKNTPGAKQIRVGLAKINSLEELAYALEQFSHNDADRDGDSAD